MALIKSSSRKPLYMQVKDQLKGLIGEHYSVGDAIPTEPELEQQYGVSRITIRKAIEELVHDGVLHKVQGKGTFVQSTDSTNRIVQDMTQITSWTEEMKLRGKETKTNHLEIFEVTPSKKLIQMLKLDSNESVICVKRVRCTDDEPIAIMVNYLRAKIVPGFLEKGLTKESLYEQLEEDYGIVLERAEEHITAKEATEHEALLLAIAPYSACLQINRLSYSNGTPIEVVEFTARADRYQYHIELNGRKKVKV